MAMRFMKSGEKIIVRDGGVRAAIKGDNGLNALTNQLKNLAPGFSSCCSGGATSALALAEVWAWLVAQGLLVPDPKQSGHVCGQPTSPIGWNRIGEKVSVQPRQEGEHFGSEGKEASGVTKGKEPQEMERRTG